MESKPIKQAVREAEEIALKYPNTVWHVVPAQGFQVVSETYFEKPADHKGPSVYNTKDKIYHYPNGSKYYKFENKELIRINEDGTLYAKN